MADWTPPDNPDPFAILNGARADTASGEHARALAQFLWFHHNVLRINESFAGVRLSFALADWQELARVYPPAREALVRTRDETAAAFAAEPTRFELFHDLSALNQRLGDELRTADAFARAAEADPEAARRLYHVAEPALIAAGRYDACGPFLDPVRRLALAAEVYRMTKDFEEAEPAEGGPERPKVALLLYAREVATLVALLVLNRRPDEAARARDEALAVADDPGLRTLLDAALTGHLPPPLEDDA